MFFPRFPNTELGPSGFLSSSMLFFFFFFFFFVSFVCKGWAAACELARKPCWLWDISGFRDPPDFVPPFELPIEVSLSLR